MTLPPLREDITLHPGPATPQGAPSYTLYDPALHRYLRIGAREAEILQRWHLGDPARIAMSVSRNTTIPTTQQDVADILTFAAGARLLRPQGEAAAKHMAAEVEARRLSPAFWLLKNYLFIRIPLVNPDRALAAAAQTLGFVYTRGFAGLVLTAAVLALYLISRQWDDYTHAFLNLFSLEGAAMVAVAMTGAKAIHELGHGLTAKRFGCRVPAMGVALLVMWPMLWTDVTDSWRLTARSRRLAIDAAGMAAELLLATAASLAWCMLADGPLRTAMFLLSSSSWLITVAVNINPLMRFDGYFLLSDLLDVPNLQDRSFALARWRLREFLFGFAAPPPERLPRPRAALLMAYAVSCWVYRFFLFLGIAVLVYHFAFKLLGIFLMAVEIGWFIVRPIAVELLIWRRRLRGRRLTLRHLAGPVLLSALLAAGVIPWQTDLSVPAQLHARRQTALVTLEPGQLTQIAENGARVAEGALLFRIDAPDIAHDRAAALAEIAAQRARIAGQGFDRDAAQDLPQAWHALEAAYARLRGAEARAANLEIRSAFAGRLTDIPRDAAPGAWLPRRERLGMLIDDTSAAVDAFISENDIDRIALGAEAEFAAEEGGPVVKMRVIDIAPGAERILDAAALTSLHGGDLAVTRLPDGRLQARDSLYRVRLEPNDPTAAPSQFRGHVRISTPPISPLTHAFHRAAAVLMREAGI